MERFTRLAAIACPLALENIDTDQLIPARFMSRSRTSGYGGYLLHDQRFGPDGATKNFILDAPACTGAKILVTRRNFGTGSSREAAVYALWDFGIRCVIAPSFGDIFASNAVKNGLLPAQVSEAEADMLLQTLADTSAPVITVDLESGRITWRNQNIPFAIDAVRRLQLLNGWDDLDLTLQHKPVIENYREQRSHNQSWAFPKIS
jgi:3-isopropylmalate/(R)-2-methylmalate dehydratase small subunit